MHVAFEDDRFCQVVCAEEEEDLPVEGEEVMKEKETRTHRVHDTEEADKHSL